MANDDQSRLADLERRLQALEAGQQGGAQSSSGATDQQSDQPSPQDAASIQAFLTGALVASAIQQGGSPQTGGQDQGAGAQFASVIFCGSGGGGWNPTKYDSIFWCRSRFMCNPRSLSCLC